MRSILHFHFVVPIHKAIFGKLRFEKRAKTVLTSNIPKIHKRILLP